MKWLPYDSWEVDTPLSVGQLVEGMRQRIEPLRWWSWDRAHTTLQGTIGEHGFRVCPVIHYKNSFLPFLYGSFRPHDHGRMIGIRMMPHPLVIAFTTFWFSMLGLFALVTLSFLLVDGSWVGIAVVGAMGAFGMLLLYGGFWVEAGRARNLLSEVLLKIRQEVAPGPTSGGIIEDQTRDGGPTDA